MEKMTANFQPSFPVLEGDAELERCKIQKALSDLSQTAVSLQVCFYRESRLAQFTSL